MVVLPEPLQPRIFTIWCFIQLFRYKVFKTVSSTRLSKHFSLICAGRFLDFTLGSKPIWQVGCTNSFKRLSLPVEIALVIPLNALVSHVSVHAWIPAAEEPVFELTVLALEGKVPRIGMFNFAEHLV